MDTRCKNRALVAALAATAAMGTGCPVSAAPVPTMTAAVKHALPSDVQDVRWGWGGGWGGWRGGWGGWRGGWGWGGGAFVGGLVAGGLLGAAIASPYYYGYPSYGYGYGYGAYPYYAAYPYAYTYGYPYGGYYGGYGYGYPYAGLGYGYLLDTRYGRGSRSGHRGTYVRHY
jgi:hypothetical protein